MKTPHAYSTLFSCIHDEAGPVGHLGRGTHYSVFRAVQSSDAFCLPLPEVQVQDFAVVWDEDHDVRIVRTLEQMLMANLLSPVLFAGERKGVLTLLVAPELAKEPTYLSEFEHSLSRILNAPTHGDFWTADIGVFDRKFRQSTMDVKHLVHAPALRVRTYVRNIDSLWSLGLKNFEVDSTVAEWAYPGMPKLAAADVR